MSEQKPEGKNVGCSALLGEPTPHDWPEDWPHENGDYECRCCMCNARFVGYKRRVVCRSCATHDPYRQGTGPLTADYDTPPNKD
jgi:hypothetical protein